VGGEKKQLRGRGLGLAALALTVAGERVSHRPSLHHRERRQGGRRVFRVQRETVNATFCSTEKGARLSIVMDGQEQPTGDVGPWAKRRTRAVRHPVIQLFGPTVQRYNGLICLGRKRSNCTMSTMNFLFFSFFILKFVDIQ
jgi:hypothetical protein